MATASLPCAPYSAGRALIWASACAVVYGASSTSLWSICSLAQLGPRNEVSVPAPKCRSTSIRNSRSSACAYPAPNDSAAFVAP